MKPEARRGFQGASRAAPGKSGLHERGEVERVIVLESWEGTRASRRVEEVLLGRDRYLLEPTEWPPGSQASCGVGSPRGNPACRGAFGGRRKAVRDRLALQGGTGDFP